MTPEEKVLWDLGIFIGKTIRRQQEDIRELFAKESFLAELFGKEWCDEHLLFSEPQPLDDAHPLFFHLASPWKSPRLVENLKYFAAKLPGRLSSLVERLKNDRSKQNVISLLHQLDAYCQIARRGYPCEWEPLVVIQKESGPVQKRPDLCVTIEGKMVYIEVLAICESAADEENSKVVEALRVRVNHIRDNPYSIIFNPEFQMLREEHVDSLLAFIESQIRSGNLPTEPGEDAEVDFEYQGHKFGEVRFGRTSHGHGHWAGNFSGAHRRDDSFRIKKKILDKLEEKKFQLPPSPEVGGYLVILDDSWCQIRDAIDAVVGSENVTFYGDGRPAKSGRAQDGVMHHPKGAQLKDVQFFAFKGSPNVNMEDNGWVPGNVKVITHTDATSMKEKIRAIFVDPETPGTPEIE